MNVGDYVRTPKGIGKIIDKLDNERFSYPGAWVTDTYLEIYDDTEYIYDEDIIKSSPQIIDLIEKNDLITLKNEYCKDEVYRVIGKLKGVIELDLFEDGTMQIGNDDIKTIITHEQMETMQYRVEE